MFIEQQITIRMISEGSCDIKDLVMKLKMQLCITGINLKYKQLENSYLKL